MAGMPIEDLFPYENLDRLVSVVPLEITQAMLKMMPALVEISLQRYVRPF